MKSIFRDSHLIVGFIILDLLQNKITQTFNWFTWAKMLVINKMIVAFQTFSILNYHPSRLGICVQFFRFFYLYFYWYLCMACVKIVFISASKQNRHTKRAFFTVCFDWWKSLKPICLWTFWTLITPVKLRITSMSM